MTIDPQERSDAPAPKTSRGRGISIRSLRPILALVLTVGIVGFTIAVFILVQRIFANFGPGVQADLEWKAIRGAQELAQSAKLGIVTSDEKIIQEAFGGYRESEDVLALVALNLGGDFHVVWGKPPLDYTQLFNGAPGKVLRMPDYYLSWTPSEVEGTTVGKVAVVISTHRLVNSQKLLSQISIATLVAAILTLGAGLAFVMLFTGAIIRKDAQLAEYAATLEVKVQQRTAELATRNQEMRLVLDNVAQGFITIDLHGTMAAERSAIVATWLGTPPNTSLTDYLDPKNHNFAEFLRLGLGELRDGVLPHELLIDQLPKRLGFENRTFHFGYIPLLDGETLTGLLVVISDLTEQLIRERIEREQRQLVQIFQSLSADRAGFIEFFEESAALVGRIADADLADPVQQKRLVHTLKGNGSLYHLSEVVQICHDVETRLTEEEGVIRPDERARIERAWAGVAETVRKFLGHGQQNLLVDIGDFQHFQRLLDQQTAHATLAKILASWRHEPIVHRLERFAEQARQLARRLGKGDVDVRIDSPPLRLDGERWGPFFSAFVHVVRNAVDHGVEPPEARAAAGKPARPTLRLIARSEGTTLILRIADDGPGIDWERLAAKAANHGLAHGTRQELEAVLFADGISTREEITLVSGRGVGMAAVKDATLALGGRIVVDSTPGQGTAFEFRFPESEIFPGGGALPA
jgi:signal transduction histidine kinase